MCGPCPEHDPQWEEHRYACAMGMLVYKVEGMMGVDTNTHVQWLHNITQQCQAAAEQQCKPHPTKPQSLWLGLGQRHWLGARVRMWFVVGVVY